jgi:hypothetical protein
MGILNKYRVRVEYRVCSTECIAVEVEAENEMDAKEAAYELADNGALDYSSLYAVGDTESELDDNLSYWDVDLIEEGKPKALLDIRNL